MNEHSFKQLMRQGLQTKDRIEKAALRLFVEQGVAETSIRDIAAAAGVSQGAMYNHYVSKDELAFALFAESWAEMGRELRRCSHIGDTLEAKFTSMVGYVFGLFDEEGLQAARARIDEAYDVLLDPARRRPYEISVFPEAPKTKAEAEQEQVPSGELPPAPSITPDTEFSGALLRAVRESQGTSLDQISERTKVGTNYLRCIEEDEFEKLPAGVYVRGFVTEFAKCLKLDPEQVSQSYLRRYKARMEEKGETA